MSRKQAEQGGHAAWPSQGARNRAEGWEDNANVSQPSTHSHTGVLRTSRPPVRGYTSLRK